MQVSLQLCNLLLHLHNLCSLRCCLCTSKNDCEFPPSTGSAYSTVYGKVASCMTPTAACLPRFDHSTLNTLADVATCFEVAVEASLHMKLSETGNQSRGMQRKRGDVRGLCSEAQRVSCMTDLQQGHWRLVPSWCSAGPGGVRLPSLPCQPSAAPLQPAHLIAASHYKCASSIRLAPTHVTGFWLRLAAVCGV